MPVNCKKDFVSVVLAVNPPLNHTMKQLDIVIFSIKREYPKWLFKPRNGSWTGLSVHFFGFPARRDDDATFTLLGGATKLGSRKSVQSGS
jgi:hypothetical protein